LARIVTRVGVMPVRGSTVSHRWSDFANHSVAPVAGESMVTVDSIVSVEPGDAASRNDGVCAPAIAGNNSSKTRSARFIDSGRILPRGAGRGMPAATGALMLRHVDLLARLHKIWGAMALVAGVAILIQALGALALILTAAPGSSKAGLGAGLATTLFFFFAVGAFVWGGVHIHDGVGLRRRKAWARPVALVLSVLNLFFLPFGTALAIYAFWVLLSDDTRRTFDPTAAAEPR
jgi:hypothetical protein